MAVLVVAAIVTVKLGSKSYPEGRSGPEAEALAQEVLVAIKHDKLDNTGWVSWMFPGGHAYVWDVQRNYARISYGDTEVLMDLDHQTGSATTDGQSLAGDKLDAALTKAWSIWCNDSWWLIAPHKIMDPGTSRAIVDISDRHPGHRGLLVQYAGGGVTPDDAYLWIIDDAGLPTGYEMWVEIIPVKGLYASWENYQALHSGAMVSAEHDLGAMRTGLGPVKSAATFEGIGLDRDIFVNI